MKKILSGRFVIFCFIVLASSFFSAPAFAKRSIILTYDVSQSMFSLREEKVFSLSAKEFQDLSFIVRYLIFQGDPIQNPTFRQIRNDRFLEKTFSNQNWEGGYWRPGDDLLYYEYDHSLRLKYDSSPVVGISGNEIDKELARLIPYPKNVDLNTRQKTTANKKQFIKAFPGVISLQQYAELSAYMIFDKMVNIGLKDETEVVLIQVSDMDMDHSTKAEFKKKSNELEKQLTELKDNKYKDCRNHAVYKMKVADRIWISVTVITYLNLDEVTQRQIQTQKELKVARASIKKKDEELKEKNEKLKAKDEELKEKNEKLKAKDEELKEKNEALKKKEGAFPQKKQELNDTKEETEIHKSALELKIGKNKYTVNTIGTRIKFKRKKIKEDGARKLIYQLSPVQLSPTGNQPDSLFKIENAVFELRKPQHQGLELIKNDVITPVPLINNPFSLIIPIDENVTGKKLSGYLQVDYKYLGISDSNKSSFQKRWLVEEIYFPGPGLLERLPLLIPIIIVLCGLMVFLLFRSRRTVSERQQAVHGTQEHTEIDEDAYERPWISVEEMDEDFNEESDIGSAGVKVTLQCHGAGDLTLEDGSRTVVLSDDDRMPDQQAWDLSCSNQRIELVNGQLRLNDVEVKGSRIALENDYGDEIVIHINKE
ncbi:hypothetical protein [Desulfobacter latus]|uniref:Uncharacterized protein n=1 Tax=Desulfobacter latus TaxID=2292 RepID=A0A850T4A1_9BACT|nr:hypothetical protein [Desulfobacter latus]NWH05911.1 hypothetical protein [Desulfobacter latus]